MFTMTELAWNLDEKSVDEIYFLVTKLKLNLWKAACELGSEESNDYYRQLEQLKQYLNGLAVVSAQMGVYA